MVTNIFTAADFITHNESRINRIGAIITTDIMKRLTKGFHSRYENKVFFGILPVNLAGLWRIL
jgi:hypothetical protein